MPTKLLLTLSDSELSAIDKARGEVPRATWIRLRAVAASGLTTTAAITPQPPAQAPSPPRSYSPPAVMSVKNAALVPSPSDTQRQILDLAADLEVCQDREHRAKLHRELAPLVADKFSRSFQFPSVCAVCGKTIEAGFPGYYAADPSYRGVAVCCPCKAGPEVGQVEEVPFEAGGEWP